jgi:aryl-alcohol dehydrogenase-like predicted oxidoreductase
MRYRNLHGTNLNLSELGFGTWTVSTGWWGNYTDDQARDLIRVAIDLGVNYIDTAPSYADSEEMIGRALDGLNANVILSTKLGGRPQPFLPQDRGCLLRSVEESLRLLKRDSIDLLMIHEPDRPGEYNWWTDPEDYYGPVIDTLEDLKRSKVIRHTGVGGTTAYEMAHIIRTGRFDVVLTAYNYNLLWREAEHELLPAAREQGMGIVIGAPLQQGALARRYDGELLGSARWLSPPRRAQFRELYAFLDEIDMPLSELALRFVISNPGVSCVLAGARSAAEVESNVAAVEKGPLPADVLAGLDEIAASVPFRPCEEPYVLPFAYAYRGPGKAR